MKLPRFDVTGIVQHMEVGKRRHVIRAKNALAAKDLFRRSYSKYDCADITAECLDKELLKNLLLAGEGVAE